MGTNAKLRERGRGGGRGVGGIGGVCTGRTFFLYFEYFCLKKNTFLFKFFSL
jgi:hypothetical protein